MECPNCHSTTDHHIIRSPQNLGAAIINVLNSYFWLGFWPFVSLEKIKTPARPLRRRCLKCGYTFLGKVPEPPDFDVCPKCGYNLTGNVSGRCPECGWKLPRRFRAYRRLADRALRGATPRPQGPTANQAQRHAPNARENEQ